MRYNFCSKGIEIIFNSEVPEDKFEVYIQYYFFGLNLLRKKSPQYVQKNFLPFSFRLDFSTLHAFGKKNQAT